MLDNDNESLKECKAKVAIKFVTEELTIKLKY